MKYLIRFNESLSLYDKLQVRYKRMEDIKPIKENLFDFCQGHLAYLMDDILNVEVVNIENDYVAVGDQLAVEISNKAITDRDFAREWVEIKDHFIPFFELLKRQWEIADVMFMSTTFQWFHTKNLSDDIINDKLQDDLKFIRIRIYINI